MTALPRRIVIWTGGVLLWAMFAVLVVNWRRGGIRVTVRNAGPESLRSLVLHVTGAVFPVGDVAPGQSVTATVRSTGESHLELEFETGHGRRRLDAGGFFEPGYRGGYEVVIADGAIRSTRDAITLGW